MIRFGKTALRKIKNFKNKCWNKFRIQSGLKKYQRERMPFLLLQLKWSKDLINSQCELKLGNGTIFLVTRR